MKIALIGSAPSSIGSAPFADARFNQFLGGKPAPAYPPSQFINETWQIWGCSPGAFGVCPRADRWFEVHRWEPGKTWFSPEYCQFLREFRGPVYTGGPVPEIRNATPFPIDAVEEAFSGYFLTSSLALMMALAILDIETDRATRPAFTPDEDTIAFFGVDMAATEEYGYQRAGCQFFVLEALRRGIQVYVPPESDLLRPMPVYGMCEWDHEYIKLTTRAREINQRVQIQQQAAAGAQRELDHLNGARENLDYVANTWTSPYGLPSGIFLNHKVGTGMGGGVTRIDQPHLKGGGPGQQAEAGSDPITTIKGSILSSTDGDLLHGGGWEPAPMPPSPTRATPRPYTGRTAQARPKAKPRPRKRR